MDKIFMVESALILTSITNIDRYSNESDSFAA